MATQNNPIQALIEKFNRKADFEVRSVRGMVVGCDVLERNGSKIYAVHIENGRQRESFWLAHDKTNPRFHPPMVGEWVSGQINTFDDSEIFADRTYKPIFDFKNATRSSEDDAFEWFRQREAEMKKRNEGGNKLV